MERVSLRGDAADLFRSIKTDIEEERGMEPTNAETVRILMAESDRPNGRRRR